MVTTEALMVAPCVSNLHIAVRKAPKNNLKEGFLWLTISDDSAHGHLGYLLRQDVTLEGP